MIIPLKGSEPPAISFNVLFICILNIVLATIDIASINVSLTLPIRNLNVHRVSQN